MLIKLADMCQVGMTDQNLLTDANVAFVTDEPYLSGRLETLKCDNAHPHLSAAGQGNGRQRILPRGDHEADGNRDQGMLASTCELRFRLYPSDARQKGGRCSWTAMSERAVT